MKARAWLLVCAAALSLGGCTLQKSAPTAPDTATAPTDTTTNTPATGGTVYPTNGPDLIAFVVARYPERLSGGISQAERVTNMQFLRDRIIEAGKCGGMDLGWNLKRGGPEVSNDFITERRDGAVFGHDIAFDYDNPSHPLQLNWGDGDFPVYKDYPAAECR
jgi:hypothetical protein